MPAKPNMTDREYMEDILLTAKTLTNLYHFATQESATEQPHTQFKDNLNETIGMQHNIFSTMSQKGWYPQQQAQPQQISQIKTKFTQGS